MTAFLSRTEGFSRTIVALGKSKNVSCGFLELCSIAVLERRCCAVLQFVTERYARHLVKVTILRDWKVVHVDMMTSEFNDDDDAGNTTMQQLSHFEHAAEFRDLLEQLMHEQAQRSDKSYARIQQIVCLV